MLPALLARSKRGHVVVNRATDLKGETPHDSLALVLEVSSSSPCLVVQMVARSVRLLSSLKGLVSVAKSPYSSKNLNFC